MNGASCSDLTSGPVEMKGVEFRYVADEPLLEGVDLVIPEQDFLGILGPNGSGKTTMLKLILGLLEPASGTIRVLGQSPLAARSQIGYVPQIAHIDADVPADVLDVVLLGLLRHSSWGPRYRRKELDRAMMALEQTETADLAKRSWKGLSGGQRQRVLIARALAADVGLLLLDEPTSGVDLHREKELLALLHRLNEKLPIAVVTHDLTLVSSHLKRAAWVYRQVRCYRASEISLEKVEHLFHHRAGGAS